MLLTTSLGSGSFENGRKRKLAKNIYSNSDFGWIYGLLIGRLHLMSMIIRELQEFVSFGLRGQKFIQQRIIILPTDSTENNFVQFVSLDDKRKSSNETNETNNFVQFVSLDDKSQQITQITQKV